MKHAAIALVLAMNVVSTCDLAIASEPSNPVPLDASPALITSDFAMAPGVIFRAIVTDDIGPIHKGSEVMAELIPASEWPKSWVTYVLDAKGMFQAPLVACIHAIISPSNEVKTIGPGGCLGHVDPRRPLRVSDTDPTRVLEGNSVAVFLDTAKP